jgi:hypothetical protein
MVAMGALLAVTPVLAHHAPQAEFDLLATPRIVTGVFHKLEWTNPHPYMYLVTKDAAGKEVRWTFELDGIQKMRKAGFDRTFVKWGDVVTAEYWPARDGTDHGYLKKLTLPNGHSYELVFTLDLKKALAGGNVE